MQLGIHSMESHLRIPKVQVTAFTLKVVNKLKNYAKAKTKLCIFTCKEGIRIVDSHN